MKNPYATFDAIVSPVIIAANRLRSARDSLPAFYWMFVPAAIRVPLDSLFAAVEQYDREIGKAQQSDPKA